MLMFIGNKWTWGSKPPDFGWYFSDPDLKWFISGCLVWNFSVLPLDPTLVRPVIENGQGLEFQRRLQQVCITQRPGMAPGFDGSFHLDILGANWWIVPTESETSYRNRRWSEQELVMISYDFSMILRYSSGWWFGTMAFYDFPFSWEVHNPNWPVPPWVELSAPGRCTVQRGVVAEVGDPWHTISWSLRGVGGNP